MFHMLEVFPREKRGIGHYLTKGEGNFYSVGMNIRTPGQPTPPYGAWESGEYAYGEGFFSGRMKASKNEGQISFQEQDSRFTPWGMLKSMRSVVTEVIPRKGNSIAYETMPTGLTAKLKLALTDDEARQMDQEVLVHAIFSRLYGHRPLFSYEPDASEWVAVALLTPSTSVMQRTLVIFPEKEPTPECIGIKIPLVPAHPLYVVTHLCGDGSIAAVSTQEVSSYSDWKKLPS